MRIVLFNTLYYPKLIGGAEVSVQLLAEGLVKQGHQVFVFTLGDKDTEQDLNGVKVVHVKQRNIVRQFEGRQYNSLIKAIWMLIDSCNPFYVWRIRKLLKRIKPDLVHTNNIMGFSPAIWQVIKRLQIPLVHTMRDYYLLCHRCNMFNKGQNCEKLCKDCNITYQIKRNFIKFPDVFVGISRFILEKHSSFFVGLPPSKQHVVYNAVSIADESTPRKQLGDRLTFGFMARIAEDKGVDYLVDQLILLNNRYPEGFKILLAGKGEKEYVDMLKKKLNGISYEFLGVVHPKDFYQRVDVAIVPSLWNEPFGRVAIEALAFGIPVCMAARGGLTEIHDDKCSWLFSPGEVELSEVLADIVENTALVLDKSKYARNHTQSFNVNVNVAKYLRIYENVLEPVNKISS
ncbi:glycosyltransferase family 4 protein [Olivibacter sp. SDN3]|uniref:glycosyltransferase family 4 protein n=1 Tax=Olivibacter sp. SDN3 TaxID=2764720 RepID=UPI0016516274|nr:glycosyltransferase family 4 protein [Olivibacter sp. SDN3]QNL52050.1 glycosyltransferase family 4 protein [Olivibacter sp. SDN3]